MIISELIDLPKKIIKDNNLIEKELRKTGCDPIRWAIVKVDEDSFTINVAYDKM